MGSIVSGIIGTNANKSALRAQEAAAAKATDVQERMYNQSRSDLEPFRQAGVTSNNQLSYLLGLNPTMTKNEDGTETSNYANINPNLGASGSLTKQFTLDDFTQDPGYQFSLDQGNKGIAAKQAASGNLYSGKALKAAATYNQDMGTQQYDTVRNRYIQDQDSIYNKLSGITNTGLGATNTGVANNANNSQTLGNIYGQLGNAQASSRIAQGNIYNSALNPQMGGGQSSYGGGGQNGLVNAGLSYIFSDINAKENIVHAGQEGGHDIFIFNYIGEPKKYIGVIAQNVLRTHPEAVKLNDNGYYSVNYDAIGVKFREVN